MKKFSVIPEPQTIVYNDEVVFTLTRLCEFQTGKGCERAFEELVAFCNEYFAFEFLGTGKESVSFNINSELKTPESYILRISENKIEIEGADEAGVFYAVQSLKQLIFQSEGKLPEFYIEDEPRYCYRGFMLDVGRYFFTKDEVKRFIDIMALHKLNHFHWHLTEDQGWRAEMLDNILLTEIGAYRSHTNFNKTPHGGFYTKAEMKEIVDYAHSKYIKVIPEIDTPGHSVSAISAYPFLSCFDRDLQVETFWGIKYDVLCVGKESTFNFIFSVFDELLEIFTDNIVHIGGDEVPLKRWELCPHCQKRLKDEGLRKTEDLHPYYLNRVASYLESKGVKVIMWNDTLKEFMAKDSIIRQHWNDELSQSEASGEINKGKVFINSCINAYYLDLPYGQVNLKKCYDYNPFYEGIEKENENNLVGVEGCLWTEFVPDLNKAGYQTFPRLGAISESAWTKVQRKSYDNFVAKLDDYYGILSFYGFNYANKKSAMPNPVRALGSRLYWERRQLCWNGLHNFIDNATLEKKYKGEKNND